MSTINRNNGTLYTVSNHTETKPAPTTAKRITAVEKPQVNLLKLTTKRLVKTVSMEKLAKKRK